MKATYLAHKHAPGRVSPGTKNNALKAGVKTMKKIYENFSCEIFPGFYESYLYNSDTLYNWDYECTPSGLYWDFKSGGWENFCKETCKDWVKCIDANFDENTIGMDIGRFISLRSPREYNFTTDKISFEVSCDLRKLKSYCFTKNRKDFADYLYEHWRDRPGFWSFVPSNIQGFIEELKTNFSLIDIMIEYYLLRNIDFEYVLRDCLEGEYERLSENIQLSDGENAYEWEYDNEKDCIIPTKKIA